MVVGEVIEGMDVVRKLESMAGAETIPNQGSRVLIRVCEFWQIFSSLLLWNCFEGILLNPAINGMFRNSNKSRCKNCCEQ